MDLSFFYSVLRISNCKSNPTKIIAVMTIQNPFLLYVRYVVAIIFFLSLAIGCSTETRLLNRIPINSIEVKVVDTQGNSIKGAQVNASNGRKTTTNAKGIAELRFGSVGLYTVSVLADNRMPNNFIVTMPTDRGETFTARLTDTVEFTGITFGSASLYPLMFNYLFSSYGYGLALTDYQEGGWTSWAIRTEDQQEHPMVMSKAFLKELENGQQWWQVVIKNEESKADRYVAEVLFSEGRKSIVRYREKIGDGNVQEKPVSEGWYSAPAQLTEESQKGAVTKENVEVTIPKGTYTADMLEYGVAPEVVMHIWKAEAASVPGGVLKYAVKGSKGELKYESILQDFGSDAESKLNSF